MYRRVIILIAISFLCLGTHAQNSVSQTDKLTCKQYLAKDWEALIETGMQALDNEIDFYYLRYRLGIAYYELQKYRKSIVHFEKALSNNPGDAILQEYLYYSYSFSGRKKEAWLTGKRMNAETKQRLGIPESRPIKDISINYTFSQLEDNKNVSPSTIKQHMDDPDTDQGFQSIAKNYLVYKTALSHQLLPRVSFSQSISYMDKENFYFTRDFLSMNQNQNKDYYSADDKVNQLQYYGRLDYIFSKGFQAHLAIHHMKLDYRFYDIDFPPPPAMPERVNVDTTVNHTFMYFGISKDIDNYQFNLGASLGNLMGNKQFIPAFEFIWYPCSNKSLYTVSNISWYSEENENNNQHNWVLYQKAGKSFFNQTFWVEIFGMYGDIQNFAFDKASGLINPGDLMKYSFGADIAIPLFKQRLLVTLTYSRDTFENRFTEYIKGASANPIEYSHNSISGKITWNF